MFFSGIKKGDKLYPVHDGRFEPNPATPSMTRDCGVTEDGKIKTAPSSGGTVITGLYDAAGGAVTLNLPAGTTNYFAYINGLLQQGDDVHIAVDGDRTNWTAVFRHSKTSDDGQDHGYHVFHNCELLDDGTTNAGFLLIDETSVTYIPDDRSSGIDNTFVVTGWYDGDQLGSFNKTFDEIETASSSGKIVLLRLFTDENISYYTLPMVGNDGQGTITFAGLDTVNYEGQAHNIVAVTVDSTDTWNISHPDYALKSDLGELADLETTDKSNIVAAINEAAQSGGGADLPDVTVADDGKVLKVIDGEWGIGDDEGGGIPDAPSDGKQYARKDGAWSEISGGSGGTPTLDADGILVFSSGNPQLTDDGTLIF